MWHGFYRHKFDRPRVKGACFDSFDCPVGQTIDTATGFNYLELTGTKFAASFGSPLPLYFARVGYG